MKKVVVILIIVAGALLGYRHYVSSNAPVKHYEKFAEEILHRRYDVAAGMTDGLTKSALARKGSQEQIGSGPAMFQTLFASRFRIASQETSADGTLTIRAVQTVLFNPAGVESALRPAMYATLDQVVTLRKGGDGWKITSFENKFLKMDSMTGK